MKVMLCSWKHVPVKKKCYPPTKLHGGTAQTIKSNTADTQYPTATTVTTTITFTTTTTNPWCRILLVKLAGPQLVKKLPACHGTQKFITTFIRTLARSKQSMPQFSKFHFNIILPRSSKWFLYLKFLHQNPVYTPPLSPICATCHTH